MPRSFTRSITTGLYFSNDPEAIRTDGWTVVIDEELYYLSREPSAAELARVIDIIHYMNYGGYEE